MYGSSADRRAGSVPTGERDQEVLRGFVGWTILTLGMTVALIARSRNSAQGWGGLEEDVLERQSV